MEDIPIGGPGKGPGVEQVSGSPSRGQVSLLSLPYLGPRGPGISEFWGGSPVGVSTVRNPWGISSSLLALLMLSDAPAFLLLTWGVSWSWGRM